MSPSDLENFPFTIGKQYFRRKDIHDAFGGQQQGGISTPAECPYIFIFTGKSGEQFGYEDGWQENGIFLYTGEGQVGDMQLKAGNKAIAEHIEKGKELLLFEILGKGKPVEYMGKFMCQSWDIQEGTDRLGNMRKTIRFHLMFEEQTASTQEANVEYDLSQLEIQELRKKALASSQVERKKSWKDARIEYQKRCEVVKAYVLKRANGVCELSGEPAPFLRKDGTPYLEVHHTKRIADNGPDHPRWVGAITPTLHREIHSGANGNQLNNKLIDILGGLEDGFD